MKSQGTFLNKEGKKFNVYFLTHLKWKVLKFPTFTILHFAFTFQMTFSS